MPEEITRVEVREGYWHLVSYVLDSEGGLRELRAIRTPWRQAENPDIISATQYSLESQPISALTDGAWTLLLKNQQNAPIVFASKLRRNDGGDTGGKSQLEYDGPTEDDPKQKVALGPEDFPDKKAPGRVITYEILYPVGEDDCKNKVKQYIKATWAYTYDDPTHGPQTVKTLQPSEDPTTNPVTKGGFDADSWPEDKNIKAGKNCADMHTGTDGSDKGFIDFPGVGIPKYLRPPASFDAKIRVEMLDCHDNLKESLEFEIHIVIDKDSKPIKQEITPAVHADAK